MGTVTNLRPALTGNGDIVLLFRWPQDDGSVRYVAAGLDLALDEPLDLEYLVPAGTLPGVAEWAARNLDGEGEWDTDGFVPVGVAQDDRWVEWEPPWPPPPVPGGAVKP